jgi:hypothetical protein
MKLNVRGEILVKKTFLGVMILSSLSVANIKYEFNSKLELDGEKGKMSSKFTPFDFKMNINDNFVFNFNANLDQKIYMMQNLYIIILKELLLKMMENIFQMIM